LEWLYILVHGWFLAFFSNLHIHFFDMCKRRYDGHERDDLLGFCWIGLWGFGAISEFVKDRYFHVFGFLGEEMGEMGVLGR